MCHTFFSKFRPGFKAKSDFLGQIPGYENGPKKRRFCSKKFFFVKTTQRVSSREKFVGKKIGGVSEKIRFLDHQFGNSLPAGTRKRGEGTPPVFYPPKTSIFVIFWKTSIFVIFGPPPKKMGSVGPLKTHTEFFGKKSPLTDLLRFWRWGSKNQVFGVQKSSWGRKITVLGSKIGFKKGVKKRTFFWGG